MSHLVGHTARPPLEAVIVMSCVSVGCLYAGYVGAHALFGHNDISLNRSKSQRAYLTDANETIVSRNVALNLWKNRLSIGSNNYNEDNKD